MSYLRRGLVKHPNCIHNDCTTLLAIHTKLRSRLRALQLTRRHHTITARRTSLTTAEKITDVPENPTDPSFFTPKPKIFWNLVLKMFQCCRLIQLAGLTFEADRFGINMATISYVFSVDFDATCSVQRQNTSADKMMTAERISNKSFFLSTIPTNFVPHFWKHH